jgi:hypothetical protein
MRCWYEFDVQSACLFIKRSGLYQHDEWLSVLKKIYGDARVTRGVGSIYDLRESTSNPTPEQVRELAQLFDSFDLRLGERKVGVIAPTPALFGMNRMYELLRDDAVAAIRVCRSYGEARDWVDLPEDFADPFPTLETCDNGG